MYVCVCGRVCSWHFRELHSPRGRGVHHERLVSSEATRIHSVTPLVDPLVLLDAVAQHQQRGQRVQAKRMVVVPIHRACHQRQRTQVPLVAEGFHQVLA